MPSNNMMNFSVNTNMQNNILSKKELVDFQKVLMPLLKVFRFEEESVTVVLWGKDADHYGLYFDSMHPSTAGFTLSMRDDAPHIDYPDVNGRLPKSIRFRGSASTGFVDEVISALKETIRRISVTFPFWSISSIRFPIKGHILLETKDYFKEGVRGYLPEGHIWRNSPEDIFINLY